MELHKLFAWFSDWKAGTMARLRQPRYLVALLTILGWIALRLVSEEAATWVLLRVAVVIPDLIAMPMGYGGLALMAILGVIMVGAAIDARPQKGSKARKATAEERHSVDQLRIVVRSNQCKAAVAKATAILSGTQYRYRKRNNRLVDLIDRPMQDLAAEYKALHKTIDDPRCPLSTATTAFLHFYSMYGNTLRLIHRIVDAPIREEDSYIALYKVWHDNHQGFMDRLEDLIQRSDYENLKRSVGIVRQFFYNELPSESRSQSDE